MKARIEKKLSKKIKELLPDVYRDAWIDDSGFSELAYEQGTRVSHVWRIGGGIDEWGEGQEDYSCWEFMLDNWYWFFDFPTFPDGHRFQGYPDTTGFRPTTINLIKRAKAKARLV